MKLTDAIRTAMRSSYTIRRNDWNPKEMFVTIDAVNQRLTLVDHELFCMRWSPTIDELEADDWEVLRR